MLLALTAVDYSVLLFYLAMLIVIGGYFSRQQHSSKDFFLAGRSMSWFPLGVSVMATLLSALSYTGVPGEASRVGFRMLITPICIWLTVPVMVGMVIPLFHRLEIYSVYEYLEYRFDLAVRMAGSGVFIVWRLLWMGGVLYAPCKVVAIATGMHDHLTLLMIVMGVVGTAYTFLGGMKAVIWTDVIQAMVMAAGLVAIIGGVWFYLDGGAGRVWEIATKLNRTEVIQWTPQGDNSFWNDNWIVWGIIPHMLLAHLSFYIADQITAQRFLTAKSADEAKRSFILNCVSVTLMSVALAYAGVALMAFYQDRPQDVRPWWIVELGQQPSPKGPVPLINPDTQRPYVERGTDIAARLEELVAVGAVVDPNTGEPFPSAAELRDPATGQLAIDRLAKHHPQTGERIVQRGQDELMPRFIVGFLPSGVAGIIFAALLAASMSSLDSGLNSTSTLLISDFYRRLGWGRGLLAGLRGKEVHELDDADELWLGRWIVLGIGAAATLFALWVSQLENIFQIMIGVCNTFGAPLLGVFMLGMLTRRCTAPAALAAMALGAVLTVWLAFGQSWGLWPFASEPAAGASVSAGFVLHPIWSVTFGTLGTFAAGCLLSSVFGRRKSREELAGLVLGLGRLGVRPGPIETAQDEEPHRWS